MVDGHAISVLGAATLSAWTARGVYVVGTVISVQVEAMKPQQVGGRHLCTGFWEKLTEHKRKVECMELFLHEL